MWALFKAANRYVIIYSSDSDENAGYEETHVRHRKFTKWIQENMSDWKLRTYMGTLLPNAANVNFAGTGQELLTHHAHQGADIAAEILLDGGPTLDGSGVQSIGLHPFG